MTLNSISEGGFYEKTPPKKESKKCKEIKSLSFGRLSTCNSFFFLTSGRSPFIQILISHFIEMETCFSDRVRVKGRGRGRKRVKVRVRVNEKKKELSSFHIVSCRVEWTHSSTHPSIHHFPPSPSSLKEINICFPALPSSSHT